MTKTTYDYPDVNGRVLFRVVRTDNADGTKKFTQWRRNNVESDWEAKSPEGLRPVFGADLLAWAEPGDAVLVVEGEKACLAARAHFGNQLIVVTWAGGSNAVKRTDWEPLKPFRVAIMPDLDRKNYPDDSPLAGRMMPFMMQPGTKAALQIATLTGGALINVPDKFIDDAAWVTPSGWDVADAFPEDWSWNDFEAWLRDALERTKPTTQIATPAQQEPRAEVLQPVEEPTHPEIPPAHMMVNTPAGLPKPVFTNALAVLRHNYAHFKLRFNMFSNRPCSGDVPLDDEHIFMIANDVQQLGVLASTSCIGEAVIAAALTRRFHPVLDYLDGLKWDGRPRLEDWLIHFAGVVDTPLHRAMSRKWLIQAVARIREPGCQADAMLILEGPQGYRKSSLLRALFGADWFSDHLPDLSQKDALLQLLGMWCIEVAELATLGRSDANKIKQFLTSPVDRYRPPYGKVAKDFPRSCVFAGTVNPGGGYLKDPTGGRRFWPITVGTKIDTDAVADIRDQLWAEADAAYRAGEVWYLDDNVLEVDVAAAQDGRREDDVWEDRVRRFIERKSRITIPEILDIALGMHAAADWTTADQMRVGRIMTAFGWMRKQSSTQARARGEPGYYYANPDPVPQGELAYDDAAE